MGSVINQTPINAGISITKLIINIKRMGNGKYWTNTPDNSGPSPKPNILIRLASVEAVLFLFWGAKLTKVTVAVLVNSPADKPETTRPTNSINKLLASRNINALSADKMIPGSNIYRLPIRSDNWPNTSKPPITPIAYTA